MCLNATIKNESTFVSDVKLSEFSDQTDTLPCNLYCICPKSETGFSYDANIN